METQISGLFVVWGLKIKHFLAYLVRVFWVSALEPCGRDKESVVHGPAPVSSLIFTSLEGQPLRNDSCFSVLSSSSASMLTTLASLPLPVLFSISLFSKSLSFCSLPLLPVSFHFSIPLPLQKIFP